MENEMNIIIKIIKKLKIYTYYTDYLSRISFIQYVYKNCRNLIYFIRIIISRNVPLVVYSDQKTSSESLKYSLIDYRITPLFKFHYIDEFNTKVQQNLNGLTVRSFSRIWFYKHYIRKRKKIRVITLLRNSIERNISKFFHSFEFYSNNKSIKSYSFLEQYDLFLKNVLDIDGISYFDKEFERVLDIDVYKHSFNREKGFQIYKIDNIELLILKSELDNQIKENVIKDFLNLKNFKIRNMNMARNKYYAKNYAIFKKNIKFSVRLLYYFLNSRYMIHFYTKNERIDLYNKYRE